MRARTLLLCIGNTLRRDDGVAHAVGERIERLDFIDVDVLYSPQLLPEHAEDAILHTSVIIVDASTETAVPVLLPAAHPLPLPDTPALQLPDKHPLPLPESRLLPLADAHDMKPADLGRLAHVAYGVSPRIFLCHLPAEDFSHGEGLSDRASLHIESAVLLLAAHLTAPMPRGG